MERSIYVCEKIMMGFENSYVEDKLRILLRAKLLFLRFESNYVEDKLHHPGLFFGYRQVFLSQLYKGQREVQNGNRSANGFILELVI